MQKMMHGPSNVKLQKCITVNILKMNDLEDAVVYSIGLATDISVGVWNMVLFKAVFLILSGTVNLLQSLSNSACPPLQII